MRIADHFRPGDKIAEASSDSGYVMTQAFVSPSGERKLLLVNKRDREFEISLPEAEGAKIEMIDLATGSNPPALSSIAGSHIIGRRRPNRVAVEEPQGRSAAPALRFL